ncbi:hypothetical protein ACVWW5_006971 [Bradyrhizobium sp. LM3.4]
MNEVLSTLEREFAAFYSPIGRPSIPPENLLQAMPLQALYSVRSERLLMDRWSGWNTTFCSAGSSASALTPSLKPFGALEELRPVAGRRHRGQIAGGGAGAAQGEEASIERSLHESTAR